MSKPRSTYVIMATYQNPHFHSLFPMQATRLRPVFSGMSTHTQSWFVALKCIDFTLLKLLYVQKWSRGEWDDPKKPDRHPS